MTKVFYKVSVFPFLLLALICGTGFAQESPPTNPASPPKAETEPKQPLIADNKVDTEKLKFSFKPYRANYFLPYTYSPQPELNDIVSNKRQAEEAKFQISILSEVFDIKGYRLNMFFTQRAFWQILDVNNSRPFREVNYNPGIMLETPVFFEVLEGKIHFNGILDHISNGQIEPYSRSQNRGSISTVYKTQRLYVEFRLLDRFPEKKKEYPGDPEGDENPDISKYQGYSELHFIYNNEFYFGAWLRGNTAYGNHSIEVDFGIPVPGIYPKLLLQYFDGYMESMIDYNRHITKFGVGLIFGV